MRSMRWVLVLILGLIGLVFAAGPVSASPHSVRVKYPNGGEVVWGGIIVEWVGSSTPPDNITYHVYSASTKV